MTSEDRREYYRQYYIKNREKRLEYQKQYNQDNKDKALEYQKQYRQENREKVSEQRKQYYKEYRGKVLEYQNQYYQTPIGRASRLINAYNSADKKYNRGKGDLTAQWIVDNIFTQPCHWCGKTDWTELGCDRINNDLPHTVDNVVPCCEECNKKRGTKAYEEFKHETQGSSIYVGIQ